MDTSEVFALLDDADASPGRPTSRLCTGFVREHRCIDPAGLDAVCAAIDADLAAGLHGVLLADYEWGARLLQAGNGRLAPDDRSALRVLMFDTLQRLDAAATAAWLAQAEGEATPAPAGTLALQATVDRAGFDAAIARIHEAIRDGETYQVNYTYRLHGRAWGTPIALYRRLRARQRVGYGALIRLPLLEGDAADWVLSRSPELFVRHEAGRLSARPMKGTAVRALPPEGDSETARLLHGDVKNRAENLMIVDLLRNDLGRVAELGSVKVPELFAIEPYATVFQMTSTIEARRRQVDLAALLRAVFPCGSITGAPKHRTMEWISRLESTPRGLYTGAIGWLDAPAAAGGCPDLCLSVAIRALVLGAEEGAGPGATRPLVLGVGGGIVLDSVAADEWEETRWKARFLTALDPGIELFETMLVTRWDGVPHRDRHRARLAASAAALGFGFDAAAFDARVDHEVERAAREGPADSAWRLRIALGAAEGLAARIAPLAPLRDQPVRLRIATLPLVPHALAGHKTTLRAAYDQGVRDAEAQGSSTLFFTPEGHLIEGGRSGVFVKLAGRWYTPPLRDGALPGVMRALLLEDAGLAASERRITRADVLERAEALMVCNALRGALPATLARVDDLVHGH